MILQHLALMDHIITNAIVRNYAKTNKTIGLLVKNKNAQNVPSVTWMFRDVPNVKIIEVENDDRAMFNCSVHESNGGKVLRLGWFNAPFEFSRWDPEFYRQAGINFMKRWEDFHVDIPTKADGLVDPPVGKDGKPVKFIFLHDDPWSGQYIDRSMVPSQHLVVTSYEHKTVTNIFLLHDLIMKAEEIHVIDLHFAVWVDQMKQRPPGKLVIHRYATNSSPPSLKNDWEIQH
jgi:hypothetical protein